VAGPFGGFVNGHPEWQPPPTVSSSEGRDLARSAALSLLPAPSRTRVVSSAHGTAGTRFGGGAACPPGCELCPPLPLDPQVLHLSREALQPLPTDRYRSAELDRRLEQVEATLRRHGHLPAGAARAA
jgi:hypothetical protein